MARSTRAGGATALAVAALLCGCGGEDEAGVAEEPGLSDSEVVEAIGFQERESLIEGQEIQGYEATDDGTCTIDEVLNSSEEVAEAKADPQNAPQLTRGGGFIASSDESVGVLGAPFFRECRAQIQKGLDSLAGE